MNPMGCRHTRQPVILNAPMIAIHVLLTENQLAAEFVAAFEARSLPEKFFYWLPLSVRASLALCPGPAYPNFVRSRSVVAGTAPPLARLQPAAAPAGLRPGSGQGDHAA